MSTDLSGIAQQLKDADKKVQLIYAFNGTGKTRLSREFVDLIRSDETAADDEELRPRKVLYYNAHTEDLFYWTNDQELGTDPRLVIQPNEFTDWILEHQGLDQQVIANFQTLVGDKVTPVFDEKNSGVTFTANTSYLMTEDGERIATEDDEPLLVDEGVIAKISRGEESNFVWSIFYTLLARIVEILNDTDHEEADDVEFSNLEYVFIDDPVSSLDENHLIELAVNLAKLIKSAPLGLKFIVTTHNPLFFNVMYNEINGKKCYLLEKSEDGTFSLIEKDGDSNRSFSYHLYLKQLIDNGIAEGKIEKYHFVLIRNLYEKTASFLGYEKWTDLLKTMPGDADAYAKRILTFSSHRTLSNEEVTEPTEPEKQSVKLLLDNLVNNYGFWKPEVENND